MLLLHVKDQR